ncbi:MAG: D-aminoacylase [Gammaproteobacteria bacterium]|nr:D-aminoacylase [Gammaproteobacteria bacterium]
MSNLFILIVTCFLVVACPANNPAPRETTVDTTLIGNVLIVDGSGAPAYEGGVRIRGDRILAVGNLTAIGGENVFDGGGLVLAPGFIDTHSHADSLIFEHADALAVVSQGITTVIVGQDGSSRYPLADFVQQLADIGTTVNIGTYIGHNTIREEVLGDDYRRVATREETDAMGEMLRQEMASGAMGLSTGLEYDPGIYSDTDEVLALAQITADAGGRYISHIRSEDRWLDDAVDEIIEIGRVTGMPVQISHIKLAMKSLWHRAPELVATLNAAREEGIDITADIYPYEYWQSNMMVLLPERDPTDREAATFALNQLAPPDGLWMTRFEPEPDYVGKTMTEIAALREVDPVTAFMQLAGESLQMREQTGRGADAIIGTSMIEDDIRTLLSWEYTNVCTDGGLMDLHPRGRGSFPRILARYVRSQGSMSLETAVRKMTGQAADNMGFTDRGYLREGLAADFVLFDPDVIVDRATPAEPFALAEGIVSVWVAGEQVYDRDSVTDARPGRYLGRGH